MDDQGKPMTVSASVLSDKGSRSESSVCLPDSCSRTSQNIAGARSHRGQAGGAADEGVVGSAAAIGEQGRLQGCPVEASLLCIAYLHQELLCGCQATAWGCTTSAFAYSMMSVSLSALWTKHLNARLKMSVAACYMQEQLGHAMPCHSLYP